MFSKSAWEVAVVFARSSLTVRGGAVVELQTGQVAMVASSDKRVRMNEISV